MPALVGLHLIRSSRSGLPRLVARFSSGHATEPLGARWGARRAALARTGACGWTVCRAQREAQKDPETRLNLAIQATILPTSLAMPGSKSKFPAILALVASLLGLLFASNSTLDYAKHLDRRLHDVHCSFIPGAPATSEAEACRVAMYSPYSALFKEHYWGGIPISLFALGSFAFFSAFAVYLLVYGSRAPRRAARGAAR